MPTQADTRIVITCPEVRIEFDRLLGLMGDRAEPIDETALLMLATNISTWRAATAAVQSQGVVVNSGGVAVVNPYHGIAKLAQAQIVQLSRELKLTPATRGRKRLDDDLPVSAGFDED